MFLYKDSKLEADIKQLNSNIQLVKKLYITIIYNYQNIILII